MIFQLFFALFVANMVYAKSTQKAPLQPLKEIKTIATDGQFKNEINCLAAYADQDQAGQKILAFPGLNKGATGFYALTNKDIHFFEANSEIHKKCFNRMAIPTGSIDRYIFKIQTRGDKSYNLAYTPSNSAYNTKLSLKKVAPPPNHLTKLAEEKQCQLTNHEVTDEDSKSDLHNALADFVTATYEDYATSDVPGQMALPNPDNFINQFKACKGVVNVRVQTAITDQEIKFKAYLKPPRESGNDSGDKKQAPATSTP